MTFAGDKQGLPTPGHLARKLSDIPTQIVDGRRFEVRKDQDGIAWWRLVGIGVEPIIPAGREHAKVPCLTEGQIQAALDEGEGRAARRGY